MKWLILAIFAEVSVLSCLIYTFDGALHSWASARLTWDHVAVAVVYASCAMRILRGGVKSKSGELNGSNASPQLVTLTPHF